MYTGYEKKKTGISPHPYIAAVLFYARRGKHPQLVYLCAQHFVFIPHPRFPPLSMLEYMLRQRTDYFSHHVRSEAANPGQHLPDNSEHAHKNARGQSEPSRTIRPQRALHLPEKIEK